ncbi:hypothetical protein QEJ31_14640 [Pigmentibacter sp. JX0631]|uniref:hypothetical protein n=1 Tax=Pigmentibacter sp. JX0631 TaxID=2976982 RepID=UPI00246954E4|nr:hypothetical protein [Pigmentibacter sp. JX0631]WGL59767.1 hypothetical protein QEJ31_14640 [Pigmentibacter sp. JX0631]
MNGVLIGFCLTTVTYVLISKLIKQKDSSIRSHIDSVAESIKDYLDKFIKDKESNINIGDKKK